MSKGLLGKRAVKLIQFVDISVEISKLGISPHLLQGEDLD
jgi:hypothetical protein